MFSTISVVLTFCCSLDPFTRDTIPYLFRFGTRPETTHVIHIRLHVLHFPNVADAHDDVIGKACRVLILLLVSSLSALRIASAAISNKDAEVGNPCGSPPVWSQIFIREWSYKMLGSNIVLRSFLCTLDLTVRLRSGIPFAAFFS